MVATESDPADAAGVPDIATLIQRHMDRTGDSTRALSRRSGDRISHAHWAKLSRNSGVEGFPRPETIRAIAETLSVSETTVVLAFARSVGLDVTSGRPTEIPIPAGAEQLSPVQRRVVWDLVLSYLPGKAGADAAVQRGVARAKRKTDAE